MSSCLLLIIIHRDPLKLVLSHCTQSCFLILAFFLITSSVADSIRESTLNESSPILLASVHKTPSVIHVPFSQTVLFFQFSRAQPMLHNYYYDSILVLLGESLLLRFRSFVHYYLRYTKLD